MSKQRPTTVSGAVVGLVLTVAAAAVLYAANRLAPVPFAPFDLVDAAVRTRPGGVIRAGIDAVVHVMGALGVHPTPAVAKGVQRAMALFIFVAGGSIGGALLTIWVRRPGDTSARAGAVLLGLLGGLLASGAAIFVASAATPVAIIWDAGCGLAWGVLLGRSVERLAERS